jgi:FtsZ-binding cell division protein ZapB
MKGRKLPRTTTIVQQENAALKNKVKCLSDALEEAYIEIRKLTNENEKLKKEKANVEEILEYREEFIIQEHC